VLQEKLTGIMALPIKAKVLNDMLQDFRKNAKGIRDGWDQSKRSENDFKVFRSFCDRIVDHRYHELPTVEEESKEESPTHVDKLMQSRGMSGGALEPW
jgi:hypothetical protein